MPIAFMIGSGADHRANPTFWQPCRSSRTVFSSRKRMGHMDHAEFWNCPIETVMGNWGRRWRGWAAARCRNACDGYVLLHLFRADEALFSDRQPEPHYHCTLIARAVCE
jgi:hypothetical protein